MEEACRKLGRVGACVERPVVRRDMAVECGDLAVFRGADPALHPVVAGESRGHEVVHPVLDPLHRLSGDDRGDDGADIARIDADLVAEASADVGRDDADIVLLDP